MSSALFVCPGPISAFGTARVPIGPRDAREVGKCMLPTNGGFCENLDESGVMGLWLI